MLWWSWWITSFEGLLASALCLVHGSIINTSIYLFFLLYRRTLIFCIVILKNYTTFGIIHWFFFCPQINYIATPVLPKILVQISFLILLLAFLPCLVNAAAGVPVFSIFKNPFVLRAQEGFNLILRYRQDIKQYVPVIIRSSIRLPEFKLEDGNLTALHDITAFYGPVTLSFPLLLVPIRCLNSS